MKTAAATATGTVLFSSTASANFPDEIRFCGCSQVCLSSTDPNKKFWVVVACPTNGGFDFTYKKKRQENCPNSDKDVLCHELSDAELNDDCKIVAVAFDQSGDGDVPDEDDGIYCNPNTCAQKALDHAESTGEFTCDLEESGTHKNNSITIETGGCSPGKLCR